MIRRRRPASAGLVEPALGEHGRGGGEDPPPVACGIGAERR